MNMFRFQISCKTGVLIVLALIISTSCNHRSKVYTESATHDDIEEMALIDDIIRAITDRDSSAFAALCRYPIRRKYPLHDIEDSAGMAQYFATIVDDSECRVMVYKSKEKLLEAPDLLLYGKSALDGSAANPVYIANAPDGVEWPFVFSWYENERWLSIPQKNGQSMNTTLRKAYWKKPTKR